MGLPGLFRHPGDLIKALFTVNGAVGHGVPAERVKRAHQEVSQFGPMGGNRSMHDVPAFPVLVARCDDVQITPSPRR